MHRLPTAQPGSPQSQVRSPKPPREFSLRDLPSAGQSRIAAGVLPATQIRVQRGTQASHEAKAKAWQLGHNTAELAPLRPPDPVPLWQWLEAKRLSLEESRSRGITVDAFILEILPCPTLFNAKLDLDPGRTMSDSTGVACQRIVLLVRELKNDLQIEMME